MYRLGIILLTALLIAGCASEHKQAAQSADDQYSRLANEYLAGYFAWRPQTAVAMGLHEFDGKATNLGARSIHAERTRLVSSRDQLRRIENSALSPKLAIERRALLASIDNELFSFDVQRVYTRNPMTYSSAFDLTGYAKRDFAPKADRMRSALNILLVVPQSLADARGNLGKRLSRVFIKTSIEEANGSAEFFTTDLVAAFSDVNDPALQQQFKQAASRAAGEMHAFARWLEADRLPTATNDFAIGREAYARMLHDGELMSESPEQVLQLAMRELRAEQARFAAAARELDPSRPAIEVYKSIQRDHPTDQSLIPDTVKHLEEIRDFVLKRQLVSIPSDVRVKVEETPRFARATSFASMDTPGPFETKANEAFYYITPTEPGWDATRKEEWLTAFNYYATDLTSIHEAYPGHYVQALQLKASAASRVDKALASYAFVEGWAHYCEQLVVDEGFPNHADAITRAKYRLEQSDQALLRLCRLCCSIKMHCQGMSVDEATTFFMQNCYYENAPARSEAERGTYDPGYGFYTLGKLQILKLRKDFQSQQGAEFSMLKFHDQLLAHGQLPIRLLREVMLKDSSQWGHALP